MMLWAYKYDISTELSRQGIRIMDYGWGGWDRGARRGDEGEGEASGVAHPSQARVTLL